MDKLFVGERAERFGDAALNITHVQVNEVHILSVCGHIDSATVCNLDEAIATVVEQLPRRVVIDLTEVDFIGVTGASLLLAARQRLGGGNRVVVVAPVGHIVERPFRLLDVWHEVPVYRTLWAAMERR